MMIWTNSLMILASNLQIAKTLKSWKKVLQVQEFIKKQSDDTLTSSTLTISIKEQLMMLNRLDQRLKMKEQNSFDHILNLFLII